MFPSKRISAQINALPKGAQVDLMGTRPFGEMPGIFGQHQLFCMPSLYEPFGIVYVEAMGAGLPVIASSAGAGSELVDHGHSGFIVEPGQPLMLRSYLQRFVDDRGLLAQLGQQALANFQGFPLWDDSANVITEFLLELTLGSAAKGR